MNEICENLLERLYNKVNIHLQMYKDTNEPSDFQKGVAEGVYEVADSIRNQLKADGIIIDSKLNDVINELEKIVR